LTDFFGGVARVEVSPSESTSEASATGWTPEKPSEGREEPRHRQFKVLHDGNAEALSGLARPDSGLQVVSLLVGAALIAGAASFVFSHRY
jgi:hypothetical protein